MLKLINIFFVLFLLVLSHSHTYSLGSGGEENGVKKSAAKDTLTRIYEFPQIYLIGKKPSLLNRIPGSASVISANILSGVKPLTGNEILRNVTGLHVVDEEGAGLRINIGIRGLDPDRSRTVLMMEDGVPVALAPYGEPEMYYTPPIDRMSSVEILKGSGSILYGPQTIGGVINYITGDPPVEPRTKIDLRGGIDGYFMGQLGYGSTFGNVGLNLNVLHKQSDKIGVTNFGINDITAKIRFNISERTRLGIKFSVYDEISNSTYVGLTQVTYDNGEYFTEIAPDDRLDVRRYSVSATHDYFLSDDAFIRTTLFGFTTTRNWLRQDFSRNPVSNGTGQIFGDTTVTGGAIYMRNSTGNRNRQFEVAGVEPRFHLNYSVADFKNELESGLRFLYERAFEQRVDGEKAGALSGKLREDEIRTGYAFSAFAQNRIYFSKYLSVTPGIRLENFDFSRDIFRINYIDTSLTDDSNVFSVVPGIGVNYNFNNLYSIFAGVHRGFAPPRIKDAISSGGVALELDAELSWNYEMGIRAQLSELLYLELTGFLLDFSNQIIPVSESSGGAGSGLVNGGETLHRGFESTLSFAFNELLNTDYNIIFSTGLTYSYAFYSDDRFISSGSEIINIKDNKLPYSPELFVSANINISAPFGFGVLLSGTYIGEQFTDELNTVKPSADGQIGKMPSYFVLDLTTKYGFKDLNSAVYVSVKNLLDERYIASRRPQGIKVGLPRFISAGLEITL